MSRSIPSMDAWLKEAKAHESAKYCGMYLVHNGTVRATPKAKVREGAKLDYEVAAMDFSWDEVKLQEIIEPIKNGTYCRITSDLFAFSIP